MVSLYLKAQVFTVLLGFINEENQKEQTIPVTLPILIPTELSKELREALGGLNVMFQLLHPHRTTNIVSVCRVWKWMKEATLLWMSFRTPADRGSTPWATFVAKLFSLLVGNCTNNSNTFAEVESFTIEFAF